MIEISPAEPVGNFSSFHYLYWSLVILSLFILLVTAIVYFDQRLHQ